MGRGRGQALASLLLGGAAFLSLTGGRIVWPTRVDWLLHGDPAQHFLGWQFFRHAPLLQYPIGANEAFGMEMGSSVVFTDSLPLLAFLFRPLDPLLPPLFQYTGLWVLACFVLQAWFAQSLLARFTQQRRLLLLGASFFLLAPPFLWRLHGHYALLGHWLLLAGLVLYLRQRGSAGRWVALLAVAALVHPYLLMMALAIFLADLGQRLLTAELGWAELARSLLACLVTTAAVMALAGYFLVAGGGAGSGGFGYYRMHLAAPIDPDAEWSRLLPDLPQAGGDYEGFAFLGLGMLLLAGIALATLRSAPSPCPVDWRRVLPLLLVACGLTLAALSHRVAFGPHELLVLPLPLRLEPVVATFRSSGRLFWPVVYLLYLGIFARLFRRLAPATAVAACGAALALQLVDSSAAYAMFRQRLAAPSSWVSPMQSSFWEAAASRYDRLLYVLPSNRPSDYLPLAVFAATHGMAINTGFFARVHPDRERAARERLLDQIAGSAFDPRALYVFVDDDGLFPVARGGAGREDFAGVVDGFAVLAPGLGPAAAERWSTDPGAGDDGPPAVGAEWLPVGRGSQGQAVLSFGWGGPRARRAWTSGGRAGLLLRLEETPAVDARLLLDAWVRGDGLRARELEVRLNGEPVASVEILPGADGEMVLEVPLPARRTGERPGVLLVELLALPVDRGGQRPALDLGLRALAVVPADSGMGRDAIAAP